MDLELHELKRLSKKLEEAQAEIDEAVWLLDPNGDNELGALREWKKRYDAFMTKHKGE